MNGYRFRLNCILRQRGTELSAFLSAVLISRKKKHRAGVSGVLSDSYSVILLQKSGEEVRDRRYGEFSAGTGKKLSDLFGYPGHKMIENVLNLRIQLNGIRRPFAGIEFLIDNGSGLSQQERYSPCR